MTTHRRHRWAWALAGLLLVPLPSVAAEPEAAEAPDAEAPVLTYVPRPVGDEAWVLTSTRVREAYGEPAQTVFEYVYDEVDRWTEPSPGERFRTTVSRVWRSPEEGGTDVDVCVPPLAVLSLDPQGQFTDGAGWEAYWGSWPEPLRESFEARRPDADEDALEAEAAWRRPKLERTSRRLSSVRATRIGLPAVPGTCRPVPAEGPFAFFLEEGAEVPDFPPLAGVTWDDGTQCVRELVPCTDAPGAPTCAVVVETFQGRPAYVPLKAATEAARDALADGALYPSEFNKAENRRIELQVEVVSHIQVDTLRRWRGERSWTSALIAQGGEGEIQLRKYTSTFRAVPAD